MTLQQIQQLVQKGSYAFYKHALTEAEKDGVRPEDVVHVVLNGQIIEEYPDRDRCLIYGLMADKLPLHVVCDHSDKRFLWIVTVYIPQDSDWIAGKTRR
jgi:hypothetical protein